MDNSIPYWEAETPEVTNAGKQQFAYYRQSNILEISTIIEENGIRKAIRRQALSGYKILHNPAVCSMLLDFLEAAGVVETLDSEESHVLT